MSNGEKKKWQQLALGPTVPDQAWLAKKKKKKKWYRCFPYTTGTLQNQSVTARVPDAFPTDPLGKERPPRVLGVITWRQEVPHSSCGDLVTNTASKSRNIAQGPSGAS